MCVANSSFSLDNGNDKQLEVASHVGDDEARSSISLTAFFSGLCSTSAADATAVEMQPPIRQDNTTSTSGSTGGGSSSISDSKSEIVTLRHRQRSCQSSNPHGIDNILSSPTPATAAAPVSLVRNLQFWQDLKRLQLFESESQSGYSSKKENVLLDNIKTTSGN